MADTTLPPDLTPPSGARRAAGTAPDGGAGGAAEPSAGATTSAATSADDTGPITAAQARRLITRFLVGAVIAAFVVMLAGRMVTHLQELLTAVAIAVFLALALEPAVNWLVAHRWKRGLATLAVMTALIAVVVAFIASMVPLIIQQIQQLVRSVPGWLNALNRDLKDWFDFTISADWLLQEAHKLDARLADVASSLAQNAWGIGMELVKLIVLGILSLLFTFYLVADAPRVRRGVCSLLPRARQERVLKIWETAIDKTGGYLYLRLIMAVIAAAGMFIGLEILGVPSAVPLSLWMGLFSGFIPTIGVYIGGFVPLLVTFMYDPWYALILLGYIIVYQLVQDYVIGPRVTHKTMEMNGGLSLAFVFAGASLFGVVGAFLALPVAAVLQAVVLSLLTRHDVMESHLTSEGPWQRPTRRPRWGRRRPKPSGDGQEADGPDAGDPPASNEAPDAGETPPSNPVRDAQDPSVSSEAPSTDDRSSPKETPDAGGRSTD
jgi:predicted PurR-regulated permease PerM